MPDFLLEPERTALINVDMQNCFVEGSPIAAADGLGVLRRVNALAEVCRAARMPVIHTRHVIRADASNLGVMGKFVPPPIVELITAGTDAAALHSGLVVDTDDVVLDKPRFGAFWGTDLEMILRTKGVDTVIISGIATNVCCETTAREANVRDFQVIFTSDGTGTSDMNGATEAELQKATLATLGMLFAQVLTVDDTINKIRVGAAIPHATR